MDDHARSWFLLILAGLQLISPEIFEAAEVDGIPAWKRFWSITLPMLRPAIGVAVLFRVLDALRMFDLAYVSRPATRMS